MDYNETNSPVPPRFLWAVEMLEINPSHHVLEIGCGVGMMADVISSKLESGKLVAIDKSSFMIEKAKWRNQKSVAAGTSVFLTEDFLKMEMEMEPSSFDIVTAFNLNFFRKDPLNILQRVKYLLKPNGKLFIFFQDPFEVTIMSAHLIAEKLSTHGFTVVNVAVKKLSPTSAICVVAAPR
jgi:ubiquinone/menaquinone biosynthesis C-methylase UbiE